MLLQIEVKPKLLGRSVTFEPKSVEKRFQQQNFFELTNPNREVREVIEVREVKKAGEVGEAWVVMVVSRVTD